MLIRLANTPRHYDWGSTSGISDLLGTVPSGRPEAELWFGTHGASPTYLVDHDEGYATLNELAFSRPAETVGPSGSVPFLLKVLAAAQPLSLQVHPSLAQAQAGFARENAEGLALTDPTRNYRDDQPKPELIVAVSEEFIALSGFRRMQTTLELLEKLSAVARTAEVTDFVTEFSERAARGAADAFAWALNYLLDGPAEVSALVGQFVRASANPQLDNNEAALTVRDLCALYPSDPGVVVAALLNRVVLGRGEALYLPAGNLHAYVRGVGIELMRTSDNVLRGGLTTKHIDVPELTRVVDYSELLEPRLQPIRSDSGLTSFAPAGAGFQLIYYSGTQTERTPTPVAQLSSCAIALCTRGRVTLVARSGTRDLHRGEALFISLDEGDVTIYGDGDLFIATAG